MRKEIVDIRDKEIHRDRYFEWIYPYSGQGYNLKMLSIYINNMLKGYGNIALSDKNNELIPYNIIDQIHRLSVRLGFEEGKEEILNFFNVNFNMARDRHDFYVSNILRDRPAPAFSDMTRSPFIEMYNISLNFILNRFLNIGGFYNQHFKKLITKTIRQGTGYTRLVNNLTIDSDTKLKEKWDFVFYNAEQVFDDGLSTTSNNYSLDESKFVEIIHQFDKDTAFRFLKQFDKQFKIEDLNSEQSFVYFDTTIYDRWEDVWNRYRNDKYDKVIIIECFWKKYENDFSQDFKWMQTFYLTNKGSEFYEVATRESPYESIPIVRNLFGYEPDDRVGYAPMPDIIELDNATNAIYSNTLKVAYKNTFNKEFYAQKISNARDRQGKLMNFESYTDQIFTDLPIPTGTSIANYMKVLEKTPVEADGINLVDKMNGMMTQLVDVDMGNRSRMNRDVQNRLIDEADRKAYPYMSEVERYFQILFTKMYQIYRKDYSNVVYKTALREKVGSIVDGIDLISWDITNMPEEMGINVEMTSRRQNVVNRAMESLTPFLQAFGPETFKNEQIIELTGLRNAKVPLPNDNQRRKIMRNIKQILDSNYDSAEDAQMSIENMVMREVENPEIAIDFLDNYLIDNANFLKMAHPDKFQYIIQLRGIYSEIVQEKATQALQMQQMAQMPQENPPQS